MRALPWAPFVFFLLSCQATIRLDAGLIRPYSEALELEFSRDRPVLFHHQTGRHELLYLAAHHTTDANSETMRLVDRLFKELLVDALIVESFPHAEGISPAWFSTLAVEDEGKGLIRSGESSRAALWAFKASIPYWGGEIDHRTLFTELLKAGFSAIDVLGFYLARQIPQWIREKEANEDLVEKQGPSFLKTYCRIFGIQPPNCPTVDAVKDWYWSCNQKKLDATVTTQDVAPLSNGPLFTQTLSASLGKIRDRFTLKVIEDALNGHRRVAVVYGGSHYLTLRKSFDAALGTPTLITADDVNAIPE